MKRELSPWGKQCKIQMLTLEKSLNDICRETNLSRSYVSSIINGRTVAPDETVGAISRVLDVDMGLKR
ncbi:XRE family transcriptional regulator [Petralouisia muris]|uniref:XRE family transcriptional regulator n=1 Tax=Petralouisia muris TaxID=3032872 RepID=A0AC61RPM6_9FIRM|nr:helix-turn-helix transcriptional regulator [Petralouisia muris]TGY90886.1 XRE family transcriptional regulator [Petralouisia muris]